MPSHQDKRAEIAADPQFSPVTEGETYVHLVNYLKIFIQLDVSNTSFLVTDNSPLTSPEHTETSRPITSQKNKELLPSADGEFPSEL